MKAEAGKSEIRSPKSEGSPKSEIRGSFLPTCQEPDAERSSAGWRFGFRTSDFFRISDFGFRICLTLACLVTASALAQQLTPRIGYVYPAGGKPGPAFTVTLGGQNLAGATNVFVTGSGVQATVLEYNRPMNQKEFNDYRDELKQLQEKRTASFRPARRREAQTGTNAWTAADEKRLTFIREKMLKNPPNRQGTPAIAETVTLKVTVASDTAPGDREIRVATPSGLSNPMRFCVGQWPEFSKPPGKAPNPDLDRFLERMGRTSAVPTNQFEMHITIPATVNGQIAPGGVDHFRFHARKGQQLVMVASARELIPYLADAVPGWFQATLALFDAAGQEIAYTDDFRFHPDPVLHFEIPRDGDYVMEIKDAIYRGREDFVYRVSIGESPFITGIFPLGGPAGKATTVELKGWNLPTNRVIIAAEDAKPGLQFISVTKDEKVSNRVPFVVDTLPEITELEPNNLPASAQKITLPVIVNGRIGQPGDVDVFRFEGRAGDEIAAEVFARRLDSPLDSLLKLTDVSGTQLALNDDHEDKASGLNTHHADSYLGTKLPADGTYLLHVSDTQRQGGGEFAYRLRIGTAQPDFELRVTPASISARGGATVPFTVFALRKDGFTNEISLVLKGAPTGFTLDGAKIPAGQDQVRLTLTAPAVGTTTPLRLRVEGRAKMAGKDVVRQAVPADDMMQAFAYRHLVPAQEFQVAVSSRFMGRGGVRIIGSTPVRIPVGGSARLQVGIPANAKVGKIDLELSEPPDGITLKSFEPAGWGTELVFQCDAAKVKPGQAGNLIVSAFAAPKEGAKAKAASNQRRVAVATLPAIPFQVVVP